MSISATPVYRLAVVAVLRGNFWRLVLGIAMVGLLASCAAPARMAVPGQDFWYGRLAVRIVTDPPQAFSAGFELRGSPDTGELQLTSPLGNTLAMVIWAPQVAELRQGERVTRYPSLDALTTELSGTALPVAAMFGWLKGQPSGAAGWQPDLSQQPDGKVTALRTSPEPRAELRIVFEP